ncbi:MAG: hypothetical protein HW421_3091 [Ignavibacteria bacterium]|nr:hypothetical protein [Ignavibacteria bacterium]
MKDKLIEKIIDELKAELKSKYPDFRGIYLFGSRARGDYGNYSDYDLVAVFDRKIDCKFDDEITNLSAKYDLNYDTFLDIQSYNVNDIINPITPFRLNVKNEGIYFES